MKAFGADRLMMGTDFPFVLEENGGYDGTVRVIDSWLADATDEECVAIMGGTAERLFGPWSK